MKATPDCQYNAGLDCPACERRCERCGWNPDVKRKRLNRMWQQAEKTNWLAVLEARAGLKKERRMTV